MPQGHVRHWRRYQQPQSTDWATMLIEPSVRERIQKESPEAVRLLDFFAGTVRPLREGVGWTVFNDWLDTCYRKHRDRELPADTRLLLKDVVRQLVFPACR